MSFGEINGDKKCNMLCNNELCHFFYQLHSSFGSTFVRAIFNQLIL